jgi:hypothetical protein
VQQRIQINNWYFSLFKNKRPKQRKTRKMKIKGINLTMRKMKLNYFRKEVESSNIHDIVRWT